MIPVTFTGLAVSAWQDEELEYTITANENKLKNGDIFAMPLTKSFSFPRSFDCFTTSYAEISALVGAIGTLGTLTINNDSFSNCYISKLNSINEIERGRGKWSYSIEFSKADQNIIPITFSNLAVSAWQEPEIAYSITVNETRLLTGDVFAKVSPKTSSFPRSFDCFTTSYSEISALIATIGIFGTLVINGTSFSDCYISGFESIREIERDSGKWVYSIKFSKADVH